MEENDYVLFLEFYCFHICFESGEGKAFYKIKQDHLEILVEAQMDYQDDVRETTTIPYDPGLTVKEVLSQFLKENLWSFFPDQPLYRKSEMFTQEDFDQFVRNIVTKRNRKENSARELYENHPLAVYCEQEGLNPRPTRGASSQWLANCPRGRSHSIMLELETGTWGCGYCCKKGELEQLKEWMADLA